MKKHLLLFAFSALALTSCEDDDIQGYEMDMLKGEWKTVKTEVVSGADPNAVIQTIIPSGCETKNTLEFRTDYYTSYNAFTGTGADCNSTKTEGTYTYDHETKSLVTRFDNDTDRPYRVVILSNSELKLMTLSDNIDQNGDTELDFVYITYKR